jgi:hypothetical protein
MNEVRMTTDFIVVWNGDEWCLFNGVLLVLDGISTELDQWSRTAPPREPISYDWGMVQKYVTVVTAFGEILLTNAEALMNESILLA